MGWVVEFLKNFLRNLVFLIVIGIVLFLVNPEIMRQMVGFFGQLFGPLAILMIVVGALPRRRKRS